MKTDEQQDSVLMRPSGRFVKLHYDEIGVLLSLMESVDLEPEEVLVQAKLEQIRAEMKTKRAQEDLAQKIEKRDNRRYRHNVKRPSTNNQ